MANPAQILYKLLRQWQNGHAAKDSRGLNTSDADKLKNSTRALRFASMQLIAIEELLGNMKTAGVNISKWEAPLDRWTKGLFLYPNGWTSPQGQSLSASDLEMLSMLGDLFEFQIPRLKKDGATEIQDFIGEIEETLKENDVNEHLRRHFVNLISHIRWCLDNFELVGEFELEKALQQLASTVSLQVFEDERSGAKSSAFRVFINDWVNPFTVGAMAGYAGNMLTTGTLAIAQ